MNCPQCGTLNKDDVNFCMKCGYNFRTGQRGNIEPPKQKNSTFSGLFKGKENEQLKQELETLKLQNGALRNQNAELQSKMRELGIYEIEQAKLTVADINKEIVECNEIKSKLMAEISSLSETCEKEEKKLKTVTNKLYKSRELYKSIEYAMERFPTGAEIDRLDVENTESLDFLAPSVILKLHHMDVKDLRKAFRENERQIERLLALYSARYTTKANQAIYQLIVIALRAELQNILYSLKYERLDDAVEKVKDISQKYLVIAGNGNQSIASTLTKFIGEIEYLFINAVKIEYNYYVKKEQARQEQLAIREQMRQEAEERRALELEKKKIENEEQKYNTEIERVKEQMASASQEEMDRLNTRILELQTQLSEVILKKETITNLQNGKAGNVYIISNLGSFGDNMFKIGMTRRLDPQERVDELGSASVPFKFDVHSFIFSEDAVALEKSLHDALSNKRVNKVNMRKEFFYTTVDELETLVASIDETAEFNKTMAAEEYRQSLSTDENYSNDFIPYEDD